MEISAPELLTIIGELEVTNRLLKREIAGLLAKQEAAKQDRDAAQVEVAHLAGQNDKLRAKLEPKQPANGLFTSEPAAPGAIFGPSPHQIIEMLAKDRDVLQAEVAHLAGHVCRDARLNPLGATS